MADTDTAPEAQKTAMRDTETLLTPMAARSASPRASMVRKLADIVVLPPSQISSNERSLTADILLQVIDKVEKDLRLELADRVSRVAESPPALLRMLLLDEPEISGKLLEMAESLPLALLIETARNGTVSHRVMIARRPDLSTAVADAVLQNEELEVCKQVLAQEVCDLSPDAINRLVAMSASCAELQPLLLRRPELEPAHGFMMFWWVDSERRRRILARFALDRSVIQDALTDLYPRVFSESEPDEFVKDILKLAERRHRPRGANGEPVSMDVVTRTMGAALKYPAQEIIDAVGMVAGVTRELAARILRDPGGEPYAVMCKALGIPREDFYGFFEIRELEEDAIRRPDEEEAAERAEYLLSVFDSMARDFARAILRYWDWDSNPRIAHITRLLQAQDHEPVFDNRPSLSTF